jgi:hypothetical protein
METYKPRVYSFLRRRQKRASYSSGYLNEEKLFVCLFVCLFVVCESVCDEVLGCFGDLISTYISIKVQTFMHIYSYTPYIFVSQ